MNSIGPSEDQSPLNTADYTVIQLVLSELPFMIDYPQLRMLTIQ